MEIKFKENLKKLRKKAGLTQKQLASELGVALSTVAMWESGGRQPDYKMLGKISALFDVTFDQLLADGTEKLTGQEADEITIFRNMLKTRPEIRTLLSISKNASKEDVERAVTIILALKTNTPEE